MNILTVILWIIGLGVCVIVGSFLGVIFGFIASKIGKMIAKSKAKRSIRKGEFLIPMDERDIKDKELWEEEISYNDEREKFEQWNPIYPDTI